MDEPFPKVTFCSKNQTMRSVFLPRLIKELFVMGHFSQQIVVCRSRVFHVLGPMTSSLMKDFITPFHRPTYQAEEPSTRRSIVALIQSSHIFAYTPCSAPPRVESCLNFRFWSTAVPAMRGDIAMFVFGILSLLFGCCAADLFTAIADMQKMLGAEKEVTSIIENYIEAEQDRLNELKRSAE
ncbi:hypothetical protein DICVIV_05615 [Dictyocaulus viviparus]|uniref:Uncharacterized protein n=1 Tax=Dictyocaulus viviparus TaxID=29172 RepID=A0A0D8Y133_DICVI|nr:hypothetical protein DICVIV_05615 [Dictyocaulus viviparus]